MKIAPPANKEELQALKERLQCGMPAYPGKRWTVMIYQCRWGWVVRAQLRNDKQATNRKQQEFGYV